MERLHDWSLRMQGARQILLRLKDCGMFTPAEWKGENAIYNKAMLDWLLADPRHIDVFLTAGDYDGRFRNHKKDKKGKLVSVEFYMIENGREV